MNPEPLINKKFEISIIGQFNAGGCVIYDEDDITSACEFYLRYKDRPDLFEKEQKNLIDYDCRYDWDHTFVILKGNRAIKYKEWLFKLAFKDVLEKGDNQ